MGVCATNCYFLYREGGTKAVVVDPAENGAGIFKLLSEKGFTVEAILLTHGHFDHIGGAAELKKASGAKVSFTERTRLLMLPVGKSVLPTDSSNSVSPENKKPPSLQ